MSTKQKNNYIAELAKKYPVESRFNTLLCEMQAILIRAGIIDSVEINSDLLGKAVIDYFEDIDRLKKFEDIELVNVDKIYGYGTFWILRRSPIQILDKNIDIRFLHINEKVCTTLVFAKMLAEMGIPPVDENKRFEDFIELVYYNFKYRTYTQQSLELMVEAFCCGYELKEGKSNGEKSKQDDSGTDNSK